MFIFQTIEAKLPSNFVDYSVPIALDSHPRPILYGFGDMVGGDIFAFGEVGDGAGQFEDTVVGPRGEV